MVIHFINGIIPIGDTSSIYISKLIYLMHGCCFFQERLFDFKCSPLLLPTQLYLGKIWWIIFFLSFLTPNDVLLFSVYLDSYSHIYIQVQTCTFLIGTHLCNVYGWMDLNYSFHSTAYGVCLLIPCKDSNGIIINHILTHIGSCTDSVSFPVSWASKASASYMLD